MSFTPLRLDSIDPTEPASRYPGEGGTTYLACRCQSGHQSPEAGDRFVLDEEFRTFFGVIPAAMWVLDESGSRFLEVNDIAVELYGYSRDEFLELSPAQIQIGTKSRIDFGGDLTTRSARRMTHPAVHHRRDGTDLDVEVSSAATSFLGRPATLVLITDRTEAGRAGAFLATSLREFQDLIETVPDLLYLLDLDGNLIRWNHRVVEVTGYRADELANKSAISFFAGADQGRVANSIGQAYQNGFVEVMVPLLTARGESIPYQWRSVPLRDSEGRIKGLCGVGRDVTRQVLADLEIQTLHRRLEVRLERASALRRIYEAVAGGEDLRKILQIISNEAYQGLGAASVLIQVLEPMEFRFEQTLPTNSQMDRPPVECAEAIDWLVLETIVKGLTSSMIQDQDWVLWASPMTSKGKVRGVIQITIRATAGGDDEWLGFLEALSSQGAIAIENRTLSEGLIKSHDELASAYDETIAGWARALDLRDRETEGHSQRVTEMTVRVARLMGLAESDIVHIRRGALLHDIGKMGIPDEILHKPGPLSDEEWSIMRLHPSYAMEMLSPIEYLKPALAIPYSHHERWDGKGYPLGLKGESIPLAARIFAAVDVWDALSNDRPYREAWPADRVEEHLRALSGSHFDPYVVDVFLEQLRGRIEAISTQVNNESLSVSGDTVTRLDSAEAERTPVKFLKSNGGLTWMPAPIPVDEEDRLRALKQYEILDTPPEAIFDDLTKLAANICGTPIALISLVDSTRQWFKARVGLDATETDRDLAFCSHAILSRETFIVEDASVDPRFAGNPLVMGDPSIRFYAGEPLITPDGRAIGTLCVIDRVAHGLPDLMKDTLRTLARCVVDQLELRRSLTEQHRIAAERRRREAVDRGTQALLRGVLEGIDDALFAKDGTGRYILMNEAGAAMIGRPVDEIIGRTDRELLDQAAANETIANDRRVLASGLRESYISTNLIRGEERIFHSTKTPYRDEAGNVAGIVGLARDITEKARVEEAIRQSESSYRLLAENSTDMISTHAPDGVYLYASPACTAMFGYRPDELVGRAAYELIHPDDAPRVGRSHMAIVSSDTSITVEFRGLRKSGDYVWVEATSRAIRDPGTGQVVELHCSARDITRRKQSEQALRESEERYRLLVESLHEGVVMVDSEGVIQAFNSSAERILGITKDSARGRMASHEYWDLLAADGSQLPPHQYPVGITQRTGVSVKEMVIGYKREENPPIWISVNTHPLFDPGLRTPSAIVASFTDITERRNMEAQLAAQLELARRLNEELNKQQAELEKANRQLESLAATDPLTGLSNRRRLRDALEWHGETGDVSLILLDIDHFKLFNDTFGHPNGDEVLRAVGSLLSKGARTGDIVARYGGEEFAVVMKGADPGEAEAVAERLRLLIQGASWPLRQITASFGVATASDCDSVRSLIQDADKALYHSKHEGRNRVTHHVRLRSELEETAQTPAN